MLKHYFTQSVRSSRSNNKIHSDESNLNNDQVDEYWRSHRQISNPICFVAVNSIKPRTEFKIMALDTLTQSLTPLCMTEMIKNQVTNTRKNLFEKHEEFKYPQ